MTSIKVEQAHTGSFLLSEGNGQISREQITVAAGDALPAGQVLSKGDGGVYAPFDKAHADTAPAAAILYQALDASAAARLATGVVRHAEVALQNLAGFDNSALSGLGAAQIIVR
jgi:hypothetical protein